MTYVLVSMNNSKYSKFRPCHQPASLAVCFSGVNVSVHNIGDATPRLPTREALAAVDARKHNRRPGTLIAHSIVYSILYYTANTNNKPETRVCGLMVREWGGRRMVVGSLSRVINLLSFA